MASFPEQLRQEFARRRARMQGSERGEIVSPIEHVRQFFKSDHLPMDLRRVAEPCEALAERMIEELPANPETTVGLRKLLEAKDAFVRARLAGPSGAPASG